MNKTEPGLVMCLVALAAVITFAVIGAPAPTTPSLRAPKWKLGQTLYSIQNGDIVVFAPDLIIVGPGTDPFYYRLGQIGARETELYSSWKAAVAAYPRVMAERNRPDPTNARNIDIPFPTTPSDPTRTGPKAHWQIKP